MCFLRPIPTYRQEIPIKMRQTFDRPIPRQPMRKETHRQLKSITLDLPNRNPLEIKMGARVFIPRFQVIVIGLLFEGLSNFVRMQMDSLEKFLDFVDG
jgi:hypothetical protein